MPSSLGRVDQSKPLVRTFDSGANRDIEGDKPDYEGFFSPRVVRRFGQYMHKHRRLADGSVRESDNWQKGFGLAVTVKSGWRHLVDWWTLHRGIPAYDENGQPVDIEEAICAVIFNAQAYLDEYLRAREPVDDIESQTGPDPRSQSGWKPVCDHCNQRTARRILSRLNDHAGIC